uniref:U17-myrmicitoxin-Tb1a n=1 Tax=Tetramorium bicarinatum TaxID=219812 RepID=SECP_TETBN|nr:RecName: Full=Secapin; AltName: Full=U17-myrmicitoxin-Tb1a; Short=U17-MYRTX-Tb1a; Flags: Precursor [Tetramorium bicarinatum]QJZ31624.1 U17-MYRTX-Tb1a precursor [Tetramorium bicarinatum]
MEKNRTNIFSVYLMITFLLISIFITMVMSDGEATIINAPNRCPPGHVVVKGRCRIAG